MTTLGVPPAYREAADSQAPAGVVDHASEHASVWPALRRLTPARIGLGRVGQALPTAAHLDFVEAHARARDAVWSELNAAALADACPLPATLLRSQARDRREYLLRPDLGRRLDGDAAIAPDPGCTAILLADGLSAAAVQAQGPALLDALVPLVARPVVFIAIQARVALGDAVGEAAQAAAVVVLIGERPGLSATDSVGAYVTWAPRIGRTDAERNCISNIRPEGFAVTEAASKIAWLLGAARSLGATGVALKDEQPPVPLILPG